MSSLLSPNSANSSLRVRTPLSTPSSPSHNGAPATSSSHSPHADHPMNNAPTFTLPSPSTTTNGGTYEYHPQPQHPQSAQNASQPQRQHTLVPSQSHHSARGSVPNIPVFVRAESHDGISGTTGHRRAASMMSTAPGVNLTQSASPTAGTGGTEQWTEQQQQQQLQQASSSPGTSGVSQTPQQRATSGGASSVASSSSGVVPNYPLSPSTSSATPAVLHELPPADSLYIQGLLTKKGRNLGFGLGFWRTTRLYMLTDTALSYTDKSKKNVKSHHLVESFKSVVRLNSRRWPNRCFTLLFDDGKQYHLRAPTITECTDWIEALQKAIANSEKRKARWRFMRDNAQMQSMQQMQQLGAQINAAGSQNGSASPQPLSPMNQQLLLQQAAMLQQQQQCDLMGMMSMPLNPSMPLNMHPLQIHHQQMGLQPLQYYQPLPVVGFVPPNQYIPGDQSQSNVAGGVVGGVVGGNTQAGVASPAALQRMKSRSRIVSSSRTESKSKSNKSNNPSISVNIVPPSGSPGKGSMQQAAASSSALANSHSDLDEPDTGTGGMSTDEEFGSADEATGSGSGGDEHYRHGHGHLHNNSYDMAEETDREEEGNDDDYYDEQEEEEYDEAGYPMNASAALAAQQQAQAQAEYAQVQMWQAQQQAAQQQQQQQAQAYQQPYIYDPLLPTYPTYHFDSREQDTLNQAKSKFSLYFSLWLVISGIILAIGNQGTTATQMARQVGECVLGTVHQPTQGQQQQIYTQPQLNVPGGVLGGNSSDLIAATGAAASVEAESSFSFASISAVIFETMLTYPSLTLLLLSLLGTGYFGWSFKKHKSSMKKRQAAKKAEEQEQRAAQARTGKLPTPAELAERQAKFKEESKILQKEIEKTTQLMVGIGCTAVLTIGFAIHVYRS